MKRKKNENKKHNEKNIFNAYQYAKQFEELSLEIVKIIYKDTFAHTKPVYGDTTQETRDYGVDAYLVVNIHDSLQTYTIESKLRTSDSLSLRDFATSVLYYLINTSARHFIVTNVTYSYEAIKYIEQSNLKNEKYIELIDGQLLQDTINEKLEQFYDFPTKLIDYILNRNFARVPLLSQHITTQPSVRSYIELPYYNSLLENIRIYLHNKYNFFIVTGMSGTGKSTWIEYCLNKLFCDYTVHKFDITIIQTPRLLVLEILQLLLGFNIEKMISELSKDDNMIDNLIRQFQVFPNNSKQIAESIKLLLSFDDNDTSTYVYSMNILIEHLYTNFLLNTHLVLIIENLHEATKEMIDFTIRAMYCLGKKDILVFWEILTAQNSNQLPHITMEQWNNFIYLLAQKNLSEKNLPYLVTLNGLLEGTAYGDTENNIKSIIEQYIPNIVFTDNFVQAFIKHFGINIRNIFNALKIIKHENLYSASAICDLHMNYPVFIEGQIKKLLDRRNRSENFYQWVFNFAYLLEGKLYFVVLEYLDSAFETNSSSELVNSGLFYSKSDTLEFQYWSMNQVLKKFLKPSIQKECATWILNHLEELNLNHITHKYYMAYISYIISPSASINLLNETAQYLYNHKIYRYALVLAQIQYEFYRQAENDLLYYQYLVQYVSWLRASTSNLSFLYRKIKDAENLSTKLAIQYFDNKKYIKTNLKLALTQYYISKSEYNYADCEDKIRYILSYESTLGESEIFIIARNYHALIKKEQGLRKEFVLELIENFQTYPNNKDIKVSYYVNLAAMYKFSHENITIKLLRTAQRLTFNPEKGYGNLEVEMSLLHLMCHKDKSQTMLQHICFIRAAAEQVNSMYILAKTFNLEAYYYIKKNVNDTDTIIQCLKSAIFHSLSNGHTKQFFLFELNLATVLSMCGKEYIEEFNLIFKWFENNNIVVKRLKRNPYKYYDHMFSALVSLLCIAKKMKITYPQKKIIKLFPEFDDMTEEQLLEKVPEYYIVNYAREKEKTRKFIFLLF